MEWIGYFRGNNYYIQLSSKYNLQNNILRLEFSSIEEQCQLKYNRFLESPLGGLYKAIPWTRLVQSLKLSSRETRGRKPIFDTRGKIALMFLKAYYDCPDKDLMERVYSDYMVQFFCGVHFTAEDKIPNYKLISEVRGELGIKLDWDIFQQELASHWQPFMKDLDKVLSDATCYESDIRYPTDVKLLWECCEWLKKSSDQVCDRYNLCRPKNKYNEQLVKQVDYSKRKKKSHKLTQARIKSLLYLLDKLKGQLEGLMAYVPMEDLSQMAKYFSCIHTIGMVYEQQLEKYETGKHPENRIVSLNKPYLRPIKRGKESKPTEFGAKVNMVQVDGINFVEHFSYDAFHEGNRLQSSIEFHERLFGTKCERFGGDTIYATNANRKFCNSGERKIQTSFLPKGPKAKDEEEKREKRIALAKNRATHMEGSFGVEKRRYGLSRIKARNEHTEKLWIFFGVHTANAVRMASKMQKAENIPIQDAA